jgi:uncharacterized protein (DUF983 family)
MASPGRVGAAKTEVAAGAPSGGQAGGVSAVGRGLLGACPRCGEGRLFGRFLKVRHQCDACGLALHHHRADDLPPYLVIFIVAHVVGYGILTAETRFETPLWVHLALWPALTVMLSLALLQPIKGAVVGLQYALRMHGFGSDESKERRP